MESQSSRFVKLPGHSHKLKQYRALRNTYMIELKYGADTKNCLQKVKNALKASKRGHKGEIKHRHTIKSKLFTGMSFELPPDHGLESLEMDDDTVNIYPVYAVPKQSPRDDILCSPQSSDDTVDDFFPHELSGVDDVHKKFGNFGRGVKVSSRKRDQIRKEGSKLFHSFILSLKLRAIALIRMMINRFFQKPYDKNHIVLK